MDELARYWMSDKHGLIRRPLDDEDGQLVGLLHDVIEDAGVTKERLRELVFSDEVVDAVVALTRVQKEDPDDYYRRVRANSLALRVKLADLEDNLDPARLELLREETREKLKLKNAHALEALGQ